MELENFNLPDDWQIRPIREVYAFTKKPRGLNIQDDKRIPFLPMETIPIGRVRVTGYEERLGSALTSGTYIENGDLLVAKITPSFENGKQAIVDWDQPFGFATTEVIPIQEVQGVSDKFYLFHLLLHPVIRSDLAGKMDGTTGRQRLSKEVLGSRVIPVPPLPEQQQIAGVLGVVQRAIEQQERLLQLTVELKKTLLHQLFTQGLRGEPQKQTEIGPVQESWEVRRLMDVADFKSGGTPSRTEPEYWKGGDIPWVKTGEVDYCVINDTEEKITATGLANSSAKLFPPGTLLMAMYGQGITRGKVAILGLEAATNQACVAILPQDDVRTKFLYYLFEHKYEYIRNLGHGANQKNLSAEILKGVTIAYPRAKWEQDAIVTSLEGLDTKLSVIRRKRSLLSDLFRTLLHQLMTAQIRVHDLELPKQELTS